MSINISLLKTASYLPPKIVGNDFFPGLTDNNSKMFQGTKYRRHVSLNQSSVDMFEIACKNMAEELLNEKGMVFKDEVDAILTNMALPDFPFTGSGAILAQRLGLKPKVVIDLHNGGCVAFISLIDVAKSLIATHKVKRILICISQTTAGKVFSDEEIRNKPQAAIPGDGAGVALFSDEGENCIEHILVRCHPEYASDMSIECSDKREWWQPGKSQFSINFDENKVASIIMRGNKLVPSVMKQILDNAKMKNSELSGLITNQPNTHFLRNWRESIQIPEERHYNTFLNYGNLFQAGIPINLDHAIRENRLIKNSKIMLAGFSHAGDYSAAAILNYKE